MYCSQSRISVLQILPFINRIVLKSGINQARTLSCDVHKVPDNFININKNGKNRSKLEK